MIETIRTDALYFFYSVWMLGNGKVVLTNVYPLLLYILLSMYLFLSNVSKKPLFSYGECQMIVTRKSLSHKKYRIFNGF